MSANGFGSEIWWPDIGRLADSFLEYANKGGGGAEVRLRLGGLDKAKETYSINLGAFKRSVYGREASKNKIDRHKMSALYIKSFLESRPFYLENPANQEATLVQSCPNECFSMELMYLILTAWNNGERSVRMSKAERKWFIILLNHYRLEAKTLDVLSLAQIIYYIEKSSINA